MNARNKEYREYATPTGFKGVVVPVETSDEEAYELVDKALKRDGIYQEVLRERNYQDGKYGGPYFDDNLTVDDWVELISRIINDIKSGTRPARVGMIKVAALAFAAIESADRKAEGTDPSQQVPS